ncbi:3-hydroxyisobutyryl-CoA hydrolase [Savitreella phatthalungensis]
MPLRAKIDPKSPLTDRSMSSSAISQDPADDVLFEDVQGVRKVILNRPKKLNSLDGSMIRKIHPRLLDWAKDGSGCKLVTISGNGRAFCAGGDVATLAESNKQGDHQAGKDYFAAEYRLDHLIATYGKPIVALTDGICMGGGVGLTINAPVRVVTEKTMFAMPESTIGFFPDVGASRFLAKLGNIGKYLACTAARLQGSQIVLAGAATHFVKSERLQEVEKTLAQLSTSTDADVTVERISKAIDAIAEDVSSEQFDLAKHATALAAFERSTIPEVLDALDAVTGADADFAKATAKTMREKAPHSLAVALEAQRRGAQWCIDEVFEQEYNIACVFMHDPDFVEGVEATLKHRRLGNWNQRDFACDVSKYFAGTAKLF